MTAKRLDWILKMCGDGGGGNRQYTYKLNILLKNDQNTRSTYINLISYFVVWSAIMNSLIFILIKFIFISVLYRIVIENACHKSKSQIKMNRN